MSTKTCAHVTVVEQRWARRPEFNAFKAPTREAASKRVKQQGQALVELGLVVTLFIFVTLGIVEFGYAFLALNAVTQATSAGARAASVLQHTCGAYNTPTNVPAITSLVTDQVGGVATISSVKVATSYETTCPVPPGTVPQVTVTVTGTFPSIFGLTGSGPNNFTRTETFRDEGV